MKVFAMFISPVSSEERVKAPALSTPVLGFERKLGDVAVNVCLGWQLLGCDVVKLCLRIGNQLAVLHDLEDSIVFEGVSAAAHGESFGCTFAMEASAVADEAIAGIVGGDRAVIQSNPCGGSESFELAVLVHYCFSVSQQDDFRFIHGSAMSLAIGASSGLVEENDSGTAARFDVSCAAGDDQTAVDVMNAATYFELFHRPP
jgi:hypothetical protein